jgi:thioredoxin-related protein
MKKISILISLLLISIWIGCTKPKPAPTEITFMTDFPTAQAEAAKSNKPMIIDFYTDWCKWCHTLDSTTYQDSLVISMSVDNIFVKINAEQDTVLAQRFAVSGYPTIVITRPDGQEIDRIFGYLGPREFYNQVQLYFQGRETLDDYLTRLKDEPDNPEILQAVAEKYAGRGEPLKAVEYYNRIFQLDTNNIRGLGSKSLESISESYGQAKDYKKAIETLQDLIKRYPSASQIEDATAMLGYYTQASGDNKGALAIYREYVQKYPQGKIDWVQRRIADLEEKM